MVRVETESEHCTLVSETEALEPTSWGSVVETCLRCIEMQLERL